MKKLMFFVFAATMTAVFFSSCSSVSDPDPVTPMVEKLYTVELPCVTSHQEPILGDINLCSGGVSAFSRVNGWKTVTDTSYKQFVFTATGYNATDLVVKEGPGGKITEERTIVNPSDSSGGTTNSTSRERNSIWPYIWPILIGLILLAGLIGFIFWLRNQADQNRRTEELHQQNIRNQEWQRMVQAMGLNRQSDGDFINRMNESGMRFSISNENPPAPPAAGGGDAQ